MKVVLAEKPSVARDLASFLKAHSRHDGYFEGGGHQVTWALGHLVGLKEPADYDPTLKKWSLDTLPFVPAEFELKLRGGNTWKKQCQSTRAWSILGKSNVKALVLRAYSTRVTGNSRFVSIRADPWFFSTARRVATLRCRSRAACHTAHEPVLLNGCVAALHKRAQVE